MSDPALPSYLERILPRQCSYEDAVRVHLRLFCTVDGVPSELHSQCSRPVLSRAFAGLARAGRLHGLPAGGEAAFPGHWSRILDEMLSGRIDPDFNIDHEP